MEENNWEQAVDAVSTQETADDYVQVYEPIMPDQWTSADEKLNDAIEKMVDETIGDLPVYHTISITKTSTAPEKKKKGEGVKTRLKKMSGPRLFAAVTAGVLAVLVVIYGLIAYQYRNKFIEGTFINGVNVGGMSVSEVESQIASAVETYDLDIKFRNGETEHLEGTDFGYAYVPGEHVQALLDAQNELLWLNGKMGQTASYTVEEATTFDESALSMILDSLPERQQAGEIQPEDAYLVLQEDNTFAIVPEVEGFVVLPDVLLEKAAACVAAGESFLDLSDDPDVYKQPAVRASDEEMILQMNDLNGFLDTTVTYKLPGGMSQILDRNTTAGWIARSDDGYYFINTETLLQDVTDYVSNMAAAVDYRRSSRDFRSTTRGLVEVPCQSYGVTIDQASEVTALMNNLIGRITEEREPVYAVRDPDPDPRFGGTYVEVDIANQHMYFYKAGSLIIDSGCVSGRVSQGWDTPKGIYSIYMKQQNRTLHGPRREDGSYEYESFVKYWMPFHEGYGLHDSSWRTDYGGGIYYDAGSHGCVNLPESVAATVYDSIEVGTPVIVF